MAANEVHKGDVGTAFEFTIKDGEAVVDVSTATVKQIIFRRPDGTTVTKDAVFTTTGVDGKIRYVSVANDLDPVGPWRRQGYVVMPSGNWHSDITDFTVFDNLG